MRLSDLRAAAGGRAELRLLRGRRLSNLPADLLVYAVPAAGLSRRPGAVLRRAAAGAGRAGAGGIRLSAPSLDWRLRRLPRLRPSLSPLRRLRLSRRRISRW